MQERRNYITWHRHLRYDDDVHNRKFLQLWTYFFPFPEPSEFPCSAQKTIKLLNWLIAKRNCVIKVHYNHFGCCIIIICQPASVWPKWDCFVYAFSIAYNSTKWFLFQSFLSEKNVQRWVVTCTTYCLT